MKKSMKRHFNLDSKTCIRMKYFVVLFFLVSCNAQKGIPVESKSNISNTSVGLELVVSDNYSGVITPEILIIKEPSTLKNFYAQINKTRKPGLAIPTIDFNKEMVVIYCAGQQLNDSSSKIEIENENSEEITIKIVTSEASQNSFATISPFCVYKLNRTTKALNFIK